MNVRMNAVCMPVITATLTRSCEASKLGNSSVYLGRAATMVHCWQLIWPMSCLMDSIAAFECVLWHGDLEILMALLCLRTRGLELAGCEAAVGVHQSQQPPRSRVQAEDHPG